MRSDIPDHVPEDLVVYFDLYRVAGENADVFEAWKDFSDKFRRMRNGNAPLVYSPLYGGYWIATSGDVLERLYPDDVNLSNAHIAIPAHEGTTILPGEDDGEVHTASRRAAMQWFTPARVRAMAGPLHDAATSLVNDLKPKGQCDFMYEFAFKLPMHLFLEMMNLPLEDGRGLLDSADSVIREGDSEKKIEAMGGVFKYLGAVVDERAASPGDDLVSHIVRAGFNGRPMPRDIAVGICVNVLLGGLDTVASMLGFVVRHLANDRPLRRELADHPETLKDAIEEFARRFPVAALGRVVVNDFTVGDIRIKAGERVFLPTQLHGMDESKFSRPLEVDLSRKIPVLMSFGRGRHQCIGSLLARVELREALKVWLGAIPDFWITPGDLPRLSCGPITSMSYLPLSW